MRRISSGVRVTVVNIAACPKSGRKPAFYIDHIYPIAAGGSSESENLDLACVSCSLRKGAKRTAIDPSSRSAANVFHPRQQIWDDHFYWKNHRVPGITATGRATVDLLKMNRTLAVAIRVEDLCWAGILPDEAMAG